MDVKSYLSDWILEPAGLEHFKCVLYTSAYCVVSGEFVRVRLLGVLDGKLVFRCTGVDGVFVDRFEDELVCFTI